MTDRQAGCLISIAVLGLGVCLSLGLLWVAVRVVAHAWGVQ